MAKCGSCALMFSIGNKGGISFLASTMKMRGKDYTGEGRIVSSLLGSRTDCIGHVSCPCVPMCLYLNSVGVAVHLLLPAESNFGFF